MALQNIERPIEQKLLACAGANEAWLSDHMEACEVFRIEDILGDMIECAETIDRFEARLLDEIALLPERYRENASEPIQRLRMLLLDQCNKIEERVSKFAQSYHIENLEKFHRIRDAAIAARDADFLPLAAKRVKESAANICLRYGFDFD